MRTNLRRWRKPWLTSATAGIVVFGLVHQVLVGFAPAVFVGWPAAVVLSAPLVVSYAAIGQRPNPGSGLVFGSIVAAGFVAEYIFFVLELWEVAAIGSAPLVSGFAFWFRFRSVKGTVWIVMGTGLIAFALSHFQASAKEWANFGAFICTLLACLAAGWMLGRTAPQRTAAAPLSGSL